MTARALSSRAAGTVVDGRVRDLQEHRDASYAVFARDVGTTAPGEVLRVSEVDVAVRVVAAAPPQLQQEGADDGEGQGQGQEVCPGDYLVGDLNGVVCLPRGMAERAVGLMAGQVEADERIKRDLDAGSGFEESSREHRAKVKKVEDL